jgi:hypothetical protein
MRAAAATRSEGADNVAVLLADLEHAADALPIHWRATAGSSSPAARRCVGRPPATHRHAGPAAPAGSRIEPPDSDHRALGMMARTLGWRSDDEQRGVA